MIQDYEWMNMFGDMPRYTLDGALTPETLVEALVMIRADQMALTEALVIKGVIEAQDVMPPYARLSRIRSGQV